MKTNFPGNPTFINFYCKYNMASVSKNFIVICISETYLCDGNHFK